MKKSAILYSLYLFILLAGMYVGAGPLQSKVLSWEESIIEAIQKDNGTQVITLLDELLAGSKETVCKDKQGISVLHWAVRSGNVEVLEHILKKIREKSSVAVLRYLEAKLEMPVLWATLEH